MIQFKFLKSQPLVHAVTTTKDGNFSPLYSSKTNVNSNINKICTKLEVKPASIVQMQQAHQTTVCLVGRKDRGETIKNCDGLITRDHQVTLMVKVADCIPIIIFDPKKQAVGLLHSGWRGSTGKIVLVAIQQMQTHFSSQPEDLILALGPSIHKKSYIWPTAPIQTNLPEWQPFISKASNKFHLDLPGFVKETAKKTGVKKQNIFTSSIDTATSTNFFSHTRSRNLKKPEGRFAILVKLQK